VDLGASNVIDESNHLTNKDMKKKFRLFRLTNGVFPFSQVNRVHEKQVVLLRDEIRGSIGYEGHSQKAAFSG